MRLPILQRSFTKFYSMMHLPDLTGMSCLAYMGQAVFAGATRNKTLPDFISCFARHVGECERTGRNGSTANYRMAYARPVCGRRQAASGTVHRRMARTLRAVASGAGSRDQFRRIPHALPAGRLQPGRRTGAFPRCGQQSFSPQAHQTGGDPQARPAARDAPADRRCRPLGLASQICAGARSFHVQFLHPGHVVRRHDLPAQKRCP